VETKVLGAVQAAGGIVGAYFGWQNQDWGVLAIAIVLIVMAVHHLTEKE